jgi:hypothetical protein
MTMDGWTDRWVVWDEVFLSPLFFIYSGMAERRMELAHGAGTWCGQEGGGTHAMGMRVQGPRAVSSFFSFLLYLFVMNDREIPRNKFDSTLDAF